MIRKLSPCIVSNMLDECPIHSLHVVMVSWFTRNYCACAPYVVILPSEFMYAKTVPLRMKVTDCTMREPASSDNGHVIMACASDFNGAFLLCYN